MKSKTLSPKSSSVSKKLGSYGKKMKDGGSLGMKSVKAGFDKNPGVTRADIITAAKGKAQAGKKVKKRTPHPHDDYKNMVDPATGKKGTMGGEGTTPPLGKGEKAPKSAILPKRKYVGGSPAKNGKTMKKAETGTSIPKKNNVSRNVSNLNKAKSGTSMKKCKYGCK